MDWRSHTTISSVSPVSFKVLESSSCLAFKSYLSLGDDLESYLSLGDDLESYLSLGDDLDSYLSLGDDLDLDAVKPTDQLKGVQRVKGPNKNPPSKYSDKKVRTKYVFSSPKVTNHLL